MSLDTFCKSMGNVVLRDSHNNPSIFVRHPKQQSNEFDAILPAHTHPAFIVNNTEDAAVLIGKYANSADSTADNLCSLPNKSPMPPAKTFDEYVAWAKQFGNNVVEMTIADHGLLVMIAHQNQFTSHGNNTATTNNSAAAADYRVGTRWTSGASVSVGTVRVYGGYKYTCIKAHTTSTSLTPNKAPGYWKKEVKVGGTPIISGTNQTYTGSGPLDWYFLNDIANEADLQGNVPAWITGIRLYQGEIQILPNNDAADPNADLSNTSTAWKAIKPHTSDDGHDLVTPGTAGTIHYAYLNSKITLVARALENSEMGTTERVTLFKDVAIDSTTITTVPAILYELGLAPLPNTTVDGAIYVILNSSGYYKPFRGGHSTVDIYAGIGCLNFTYGLSSARNWIGSRSRARELVT